VMTAAAAWATVAGQTLPPLSNFLVTLADLTRRLAAMLNLAAATATPRLRPRPPRSSGRCDHRGVRRTGRPLGARAGGRARRRAWRAAGKTFELGRRTNIVHRMHANFGNHSAG
jgi:hypothetical protein